MYVEQFSTGWSLQPVLKGSQGHCSPGPVLNVTAGTKGRRRIWHVMIKFMPLLKELYARLEKRDFKDIFHSVINHPLTVQEFGQAWSWMLGEFDLNDDPAMQSLYETRKQWAPAYL
ncbi:hypothetical protein C2845_PM17G09600 [Panicum miliaceum]|uniref:Protein FAR1-RELATED SEQUENCE n=1 Tax=Panicum miliaceum TaxID=4540 RepID=A0A3L6Q618_PANMI|nr:hypothetical protein C2845_PM17G09600 [Panicum miliaceum]